MSKSKENTKNKLVKVNNSRYTAIINGKQYSIFFSYGLKKELFDIISESYVNSMKSLRPEGGGGGDAANAPIEAHINIIRGMGELSGKIVSKVLTQRDNEGNIVKEVTEQHLSYGEDFEDCEDVLNEIYDLVAEKYVETAKKNTSLMETMIKPLTQM